MDRSHHDRAKAIAFAVLDMVGHLLRPEEQHEFFGMVVEAVVADLLRFEELRAAELARLRQPSVN